MVGDSLSLVVVMSAAVNSLGSVALTSSCTSSVRTMHACGSTIYAWDDQDASLICGFHSLLAECVLPPHAHPSVQEEAAKEVYWKTYFDKSTTEARNGGAHAHYLALLLKVC